MKEKKLSMEAARVAGYWVEHFSVKLNNGEIMVAPLVEVDRLIKENIRDAKKLNPAYDYIRVYAAGSYEAPDPDNPGEESDCDRIKMAAREAEMRRILDSAPEKMHARFGGFR